MTPDLSRRALIASGLTVPAAAAAASPAAASPASASPAQPRAAAAGGPFDADSPRFTLAVLPDTQYLFDADAADPAPLAATLAWLREHRAEENIAFLAHLGDVTEHGTEAETALAARVFDTELPPGRRNLPHAVVAGNHDVSGEDTRGATPFLHHFGPGRAARVPTHRGSSPDGYSSHHVVRAGGRDWLVLALDWRLSEAGLAWAGRVLDENPSLPTVLVSHELVSADGGDGTAQLSEYGRRLWEELVRGRDQVFLTLNGHFWPVGRTVLTNDAGNPVHAHLANYQDRYYGGAAALRLYRFDLERGVVDVETFSPWLRSVPEEERTPLQREEVERTSGADRFSFELVPARRFAGFAPPVVPDPRPAPTVVGPHTAAYWRFDALPGAAEGAVVAAGTVVEDLSGNGNDLTARLIGAGTAGALTWSAEHHDGQPAHASLRFDGRKDPDGGAVLETAPGAPLNSETFLSGFTIEVFLKLPDPFTGDHAWMGVLSWEGRNGDAGKTQGYSPDEPTCSLNVSPERFLQFVLYPELDDLNPTSWTHALDPGRWVHVAIVNDGRRSVVHVEGSRTARNPSTLARGIATLGKPFALGATQSEEVFGQGFHGWVGDVRISSRALEPGEFLSAPVTATRED
ncbi:metallophosphoesterase [Kineococcus sp. TRM81007]|uniref:LamG-like jellyroll fold domain-containing protein n=1 Tax=Kineococcus sp. TRM81007 TaxID=2925831 RepID=UPI001F56AA04|nr:LamG-like jellyroll fold domain-containing protein [Kineococcus sp. TRM81007]MCI2240409.1 metallophosphoesterase [Kineococcus sp. TRM81007]